MPRQYILMVPGQKKYHENLKLSVQEDDDIINIHYGAFRVSLPSGWKKKVENEAEVTFTDKKGENRGGARILGYSYDEPGHRWRPNHSTDISQERIATSFGEGELVVLERGYPAASGKDDVWKEVHAVIPIQNQELMVKGRQFG